MEKIKILFYSHTIDFGGTWRSHERILLNLNKDEYDVFVLYNPNQNNNRLSFLKTKLPEDRIIPFEASKEKTGPIEGYSYVTSNFHELCEKFNFDIIHFARSGHYEWPFTKRICPIQIETNIFGGKDDSEFLDCSVTISDKVTLIRGSADYMIYNPIPLPYETNDNLKSELNISEDYFVFGRVGRQDNFHPIALNALRNLKNNGVKFKYLILGACNETINTINKLNLKENCIIFDTTNDDMFIHKFHNTIDMFLHYRSDGETFGTAIAQSMMYGKPVISHYAGYNAQEEIISEGGFVCMSELEFLEKIILLMDNKNMYKEISEKAKKRAKEFEEKKIVSYWETLYKKLYDKRQHN